MNSRCVTEMWRRPAGLMAVLVFLAARPSMGQEPLAYRGFRLSMPFQEFLEATQRAGVSIHCETGPPAPGAPVTCSTLPTQPDAIMRVSGAVDTTLDRVTAIHVLEPWKGEVGLIEWLASNFRAWGTPDTTFVGTLVWFRGEHYAQIDTAEGHRAVTLGHRSPVMTALQQAPPARPRPLSEPGEVFLADEVDVPPRLASCPPPDYPPAALRLRIQDNIRLEFVIGLDGKAEPGSFVVVSGKHLEFMEAAVTAVLSCEFTTGQVQGRPVRTIFVQPVAFRLRDGRK